MWSIRRLVLWLMLLGVSLTSGCSPIVEKNTVEEIAPVIFFSIEKGEEGKLKLSTLVPPLSKEKQRLFSVQVDLLKQGKKKFNLSYYRELKLGQLRVLLINEELARKGMKSIINTTLSDPNISQRLYIVIVRGNFEKYLKKQVDEQNNFDYYLYRMLKHYETNNEGELTVVNLHQFMKQLYSPYTNPTLPVFEVSNEDFTYKGTAVFREDKLVTTIINTDDHILQLLSNKRNVGVLPIKKLSVTLGNLHANVDMEFNREYTQNSIKVEVDAKIEEYRGKLNLYKRNDLKTLQRQIESHLEQQSLALLRNMQKRKVDPLQMGKYTLHPFSRPLSEEEWLHYSERMKFAIDYEVQIQPLTNVPTNRLIK